MKAIKFTISGAFAHFKKPDVNAYAYFTYGHIHKVALLGIFGSIMGLEGYKEKIEDYPEFYKALRHLKVAIIPKKPYFTKKIQVFNNSVGYASQEEGGNLIVREQWLEDVAWDIVVANDGTPEFKELKERLQKRAFVYLPYLGKNDHPANIGKVQELELKPATEPAECISLVPKDAVRFVKPPSGFGAQPFYYEEFLPMGLKEKFLIYEYEKMVLSNWVVEGEMWGYKEGGIKFI